MMPTIDELRDALKSMAPFMPMAECPPYDLLWNALDELDGWRKSVEPVKEGERQVIQRKGADGGVLEIVREAGWNKVPDIGAYTLGIQQFPADPKLVEITLFHEVTGQIAWRVGYTVQNAVHVLMALAEAIQRVEDTMQCKSCRQIVGALHQHRTYCEKCKMYHAIHVCEACCATMQDFECLKGKAALTFDC